MILAGAGTAHALPGQSIPECQPLDTPKRLPTVAALVDSTELIRRIADVHFADSSEVQMGVAFPRAPGAPTVWVAAAGTAPESHSHVAALVQASLRQDGAPRGATFRIHFRATPSIALRIEHSTLCAPTPLDSLSGGTPAFRMTEGSGTGPPSQWKSGVRQRIGTDGRVLEAQLMPGSGQPELDRVALQPVYARRWRPATLDGRPVVVWFANGKVTLAK